MGRGSPRKEIKNPMGQHGKNDSQRPIATTKGKSKVNGSWKPKKRGKKPYGPTWQK